MFTSSAIHVPLAGLVSAFYLSDLAGKLIVIVLVVVSVTAWSIALAKLLELRQAWQATLAFLAAYRKEPHPMALYLRRQRYEGSPAYALYEKACAALGGMAKGITGGADVAEDLFMGAVGTTARLKLDPVQMHSIRSTMQVVESEQLSRMERQVGILWLAVVLTPLVGLMGAAWSVMDLLSDAGSAPLSLVLPQAAGGLVSLVVGLLVAIPSVICYSAVRGLIGRLKVEMERMAGELDSAFETHYLSGR